jgi:hypothetical protein
MLARSVFLCGIGQHHRDNGPSLTDWLGPVAARASALGLSLQAWGPQAPRPLFHLELIRCPLVKERESRPCRSGVGAYMIASSRATSAPFIALAAEQSNCNRPFFFASNPARHHGVSALHPRVGTFLRCLKPSAALDKATTVAAGANPKRRRIATRSWLASLNPPSPQPSPYPCPW